MGTEHTGQDAAARALEIRHEERGGHGVFFVERGGERIARLVYSRAPDGRLATLEHTEVSDVLSGQGVGRALVEAAVAWARAENVRLHVQCPFARKVIARDPKLQDVLAEPS